MIRKTLLVLVLSFAAIPAYADFQRIKTKAMMTENVVDNKYVNPKDGAWFVFRADGNLDGGYKKEPLTGNWRWKSRMACFSRSLGDKKLPDDCIVIHIDGNQLITIRDRGKGRQTLYKKR